MGQPYDIFVSYSSKDSRFVERLATALRNSGLTVWLDKWEIQAGDRLRDRIATGIQEAKYFIVVLSPNSLIAPWVKYELDSAMIREIELARVIVLPIIYGDIDLKSLPSEILGKFYLDFRKRHLFEKGVKAIKGRFLDPPYKYRILDGETIVDLVDPSGALARVTRRRHIRCLTDGITHLRDEYYSDGPIENVRAEVGTIETKRVTLGRPSPLSSSSPPAPAAARSRPPTTAPRACSAAIASGLSSPGCGG